MKLKILVFIISVFISCIGFSQTQVDSLIKLYHSEKNIDTLLKYAAEIGKFSIRNNPDLYKKMIYPLIKDSNKITNKYDYAINLNILGIVHQYQDDLDSAEYYINWFYKLSKELNDDHLSAIALNNMALNYRKRSDYETAVKYFLQALEYDEKQNDRIGAAGKYNDIGNTYLFMNNYKMGMRYQKKALKTLEHVDSLPYNAKSIKANTYNSIGYAFKETNQNDSAKYYYTKSLKIKKEINNLYSWCNTKLNLCNMIDNKTQECVECLSELIEVEKRLNDREGIATAKINLAVCFSQQDNPKKSLEVNLDLLRNYKDIFSNKALASLYKNIASDYYLMHDFQSAYEYRIYYDHYKDSVRQEIYDSDILEMTEKFESARKDKEIAAQKLEISDSKLKISETELQVSNRNKLIYGLTGGVLTILFLALFIIQRNRRKAEKDKNDAIIAEKEKGLEAIIDAQEEERKRIAKDLHDGVGQQISALNLNFQQLSKEVKQETQDLNPEMDKINQMIKDTGTDIRQISHQMMPRALTEFGLIDAIQDMIEKSFIHSDIICKFDHHNMENRLPQNIEIGLYRITQELINNILKHSGAKNVDIQLMKNESHCILIVQDDGKGMEQKKNSGIGIQNMSTRINALKGEFNIETETDKGTTAFVKIKLPDGK